MADGGEDRGAEAGAVTRADLCREVHRTIGLSKAECAKILDTVLGEICGALHADHSVKIVGFGTFAVRAKTQRLGRNPKSGDVVIIPGRRVVSFNASQAMRARMAGSLPE